MATVRIQFAEARDDRSRDPLELLGPTLPVQIGYDRKFQPGGSSRVDLPEVRLPALVDTGSLECCVDSGLAAELRLPIIDTGAIAGVYGTFTVNFHLAQLYIPDLEWLIYGAFPGVHLTCGAQHHKALLGRNFLQRFTMMYQGHPRIVTISNDWV